MSALDVAAGIALLALLAWAAVDLYTMPEPSWVRAEKEQDDE